MKDLQDFATYAEYTQYCRDLEIAEQGSTEVTLSDGSKVEIVGNDYDIQELERAHDRALMRKSGLVVPPSNGMFHTDDVDWDRI